MTRLFGRAPRGERVHAAVPQNYGQSVSLLGVLDHKGICAAMSVDGPTDTAVLKAFVQQVLIPTLVPGDIVVMDNLSVHKVRQIRELIEAAGAQVWYLPPYSPELSPIEPCWSKLKSGLRSLAARSREALDEAITQAFSTITASDAQGWFRHCGYSLYSHAIRYM